MSLVDKPNEATNGQDEARLAQVVEMMRELSRQTDPQQMVMVYGARIQRMLSTGRLLALSRRDLDWPRYRITRNSDWGLQRDPWKEHNLLPLLDRGLLGELLYGNEPRIINDLKIAPDDPTAPYLSGMRSLMAIPVWEHGVALNMTVAMRREANGFTTRMLADQVWMTNLFGRATHSLLLSRELEVAYASLDEEMKVIADLQRSLLPGELPDIPTMQLAAHYRPAARAGGDYYDFFPMSDGTWGIIIADVSGHGSPAAVLMAVTHALAHTHADQPTTPAQMLDYVNYRLAHRYTSATGRFVTAFFGLYDPATRQLTYASAGHNPPRVKRCGTHKMFALDAVGNPPLGIDAAQKHRQTACILEAGDQIIFYTDGITEAFNNNHEMFGVHRLDEVLGECSEHADGLIQSVLAAVEAFTAGRPPEDDQTIVVARLI